MPNLIALAFLIPCSISSCLAQSDTFIILGAGDSPPWKTEYFVSNTAGESANVELIGFIPSFVVCPPVLGCVNKTGVELPPNGSALIGSPHEGYPAVFVKRLSGATPSIRARVFNEGNPAQAAELPVFRIKTLLALNPGRLAFPIRTNAARTNLLLANVADPDQTTGEDISVNIEVFSSDGQSRGSRSIPLPFGQVAFVVNIGEYLGIPNPTGGQVRVTRTAGAGVFWGILPSKAADGTISIGLGAVP